MRLKRVTKLSGDGRTARITITPEIIKTSTKANSSHCAIAEAVKKVIPDAQFVSVDLQTIRFSDDKYRYTYLTPRSAQRFIVDFDQGKKLSPLAFMLRDAMVTQRASSSAPKLPKKPELRNRNASKTQRKIPQRVGGKTPPKIPSGTRRQFGLRALDR